MENRRSVVLADPDEFGFGIKMMKKVKVCRHCGSMEPAGSYTCSRCGERLPVRTLFQIYQQMHGTCEVCDTVVSGYMNYCPHCGNALRGEEK